MFKITHGELTINHFVKVLFKFDDKLLFGFAKHMFPNFLLFKPRFRTKLVLEQIDIQLALNRHIS